MGVGAVLGGKTFFKKKFCGIFFFVEFMGVGAVLYISTGICLYVCIYRYTYTYKQVEFTGVGVVLYISTDICMYVYISKYTYTYKQVEVAGFGVVYT